MPQIQIFISEDNKLTHDLTEEKVTVGRLADNTLPVSYTHLTLPTILRV